MRAKTSQFGLKQGRFLSTIAGLSTLLFVSSACQFGGSFEETRCDTKADCSGEAVCIEGFCALPNLPDDKPDVVEDISEDVGEDIIEDVEEDIVEDVEEDIVDDIVTEPELVAVELSAETLSLQVGAAETLTAAVIDEFGEELQGVSADEFSWSSDAPGIALVSSVGEVRGLAVGQANITATYAGLSATAAVTVSAADAAQIEIFPSTITLTQNNVFTAQARAYDVNGALIVNPLLDWSVSDPSVATVDSDGKVSAVGAGNADLVVSINGAPSVTATSQLIVNPLVPASAIISPSQATITVGQTVQFEVYDDDLNLVDAGTVNWSSADPSVATVNSTGQVQGVAAGSVAITGVANGVTVTANVVVEARQVARVEIDQSLFTLDIGVQATAVATAFAADGTDISSEVAFAWTVADTSVASNDGSGKVTGLSQGVTTLQVSTNPGNVSAFAGIKVNRHPVDSVEISNATTSPLSIGDTLQLGVTLYAPGGGLLANPAERIVQWESNKEHIAVVDGTGKVTALSAGNVKIKATSEGKSDEVTLTVAPDAPPANQAPTAFPQAVSVQKNGSISFQLFGSDPEDGSVSEYRLASGSGVTKGILSGFNSSSGAISYTPNPGETGTDSFEFEVKDSDGEWSAAAAVSISIVAGHAPPVADAGADISGDVCTTEYTLDGSASTADNSGLTYAWEIVYAVDAGANLEDQTTVSPTLKDAENPGGYVLKLTVTDDRGVTSTDFVVIELGDEPNAGC